MSTASPETAEEHEREAARCLGEAVALVAAGVEPDRRERQRRLLGQAIAAAERASGGDAPRSASLSILARAHAARALDALHGAGQLSRGAQRAPTAEACDDGWERVEEIVATAEEAAREAERAAHALERSSSTLARAARVAAAKADAAAKTARALVFARNHAYTFHADFGFSFGEGWYVAAAALLAGTTIQIEPGKPATAQAERFLRDAGLAERAAPYLPRPRANKQTTDLVARAFRKDPRGAQERLRSAFLGAAPIAVCIRDFIEARLAAHRDRQKVLLWIRDGAHHPGRNTSRAELLVLTARVLDAGLAPILVGDPLREGPVPADAIDMLHFWKDPVFRGDDARRAQLQFFEHLRREHGVLGQLGVTTAGMDGPALLGMPTIYLTEAPNPRMGAWVGAVPGYREIVRGSGYVEEVMRGVNAWTTTPTTVLTSIA